MQNAGWRAAVDQQKPFGYIASPCELVNNTEYNDFCSDVLLTITPDVWTSSCFDFLPPVIFFLRRNCICPPVH